MKVYFHVFVTHNDKLLVVNSPTQREYFVPGTVMLTADPYDEFLIKTVQRFTGLTVFIKKPFFLRDDVVRTERTMEIFLEAQAASDEVKLSSELLDAKWIEPENYASENTVEHLHQAFEAYSE